MRVCVFCGSSSGRDERYLHAARDVAGALARRGIGLVYGGARVGLMGTLADAALADAALAAGAEVVGVLPAALADREIAHTGLSELHVVDGMHQRKARMAELSDAFLALPGGAGTLDEFFEVWTWSQLGLHTKPCGLLNVAGFFDPLTAFLDHASAEGFLAAHYLDALLVADDPEVLLDPFGSYRPPVVKWAVPGS